MDGSALGCAILLLFPGMCPDADVRPSPASRCIRVRPLPVRLFRIIPQALRVLTKSIARSRLEKIRDHVLWGQHFLKSGLCLGSRVRTPRWKFLTVALRETNGRAFGMAVARFPRFDLTLGGEFAAWFWELYHMGNRAPLCEKKATGCSGAIEIRAVGGEGRKAAICEAGSGTLNESCFTFSTFALVARCNAGRWRERSEALEPGLGMLQRAILVVFGSWRVRVRGGRVFYLKVVGTYYPGRLQDA